MMESGVRPAKRRLFMLMATLTGASGHEALATASSLSEGQTGVKQ